MSGAASFDAGSGREAQSSSELALALVAACCRRPLDLAAVHAAAAHAIDWPLFAQTARRHRVVGLVHEAAHRAALALPADIAAGLAGEARRIASINIAHARESVRLQRALDRAGIPRRFLKGVALAQSAYGSLTTKHARDIDLLVPPAQVPAALAILLAEGYALHEPAHRLSPAQIRAMVTYGSQAELVRRGARLRLELHWRLSANPWLPHGIDPFAGGAATTLPGIGDIDVLRPDDEFVYLCVHGAGHHWSRLKWLADLDARLSTFDAEGIASLYSLAEAHGAGLCAGQALLMCHRHFGRALPEDLRGALSGDPRIAALVALAERRMREADAAGAARWRAARTFHNVIDPFRLGRGRRFVAAQMRQLLVGPGDPVRVPLPRALVFLYPLMRLPMWLWRQLPARRKQAAGKNAAERSA